MLNNLLTAEFVAIVVLAAIAFNVFYAGQDSMTASQILMTGDQKNG